MNISTNGIVFIPFILLNKLPMWVIAFFSVLLVAVIIYAALVKNKTKRDKFMDEPDPADDDDASPHSPLR